MRIIDNYDWRDSMSIRTKSVFIWLIICHFSISLIYADNHLETEIEKLRKTERVTGRSVGIGGEPGEFFELSKVFLQKGNEEDFLKLTSDENPVVRSMGVLCLIRHQNLPIN
jgi:hypothetical protein